MLRKFKCWKSKLNGTKPIENHLTFTDGQVVAPLSFSFLDTAVDLVAAHQLVALPAPEGQHAAHRHTRTALHVERAPAWWQHRDAGKSWGRGDVGGGGVAQFSAQMFHFTGLSR